MWFIAMHLRAVALKTRFEQRRKIPWTHSESGKWRFRVDCFFFTFNIRQQLTFSFQWKNTEKNLHREDFSLTLNVSMGKIKQLLSYVNFSTLFITKNHRLLIVTETVNVFNNIFSPLGVRSNSWVKSRAATKDNFHRWWYFKNEYRCIKRRFANAQGKCEHCFPFGGHSTLWSRH